MNHVPVALARSLRGATEDSSVVLSGLLAHGGEKVQLVTTTQKDACESLGIVNTDQQLGLNKASNSINKAINEVARRGGNAIFIVSNGPVVSMALR